MTTEEKLAIAVQALRDIANPLDKLQRECPANSRLDGKFAAMLCNDAEHLKREAKAALSVLDGETTAPPVVATSSLSGVMDGGGF